MNKLSYKILDEEEKISSSCPDFRIFVDGKETNHFFDVEELGKSGEKDGIYPIITCYCGETSCSGSEVRVSHRGNEILFYSAIYFYLNIQFRDRIGCLLFCDIVW